MIKVPELLVDPAKQAGILVPENLDDFDKEQYPHWYVYCFIQLYKPMHTPTEHWDNAKAIVAIPKNKIRETSLVELVENYGVTIL